MSSTPAGPDPAAPGCPLPRLPAGDAQLALHLPLFDQVDAHHLDAVRSVREDNETGLLTSADLHVAATVLRLTGHTGADLAAVIARVVAAARAGSSCLRLNPEQARLLRSHQQPDGPGPGTATGTVALVGTADRPAPIRLVGERAYLDRYWRLERAVAAAVLARATTLIPVDPAALRRSVHTHLPGPDQHWQRVAAAMAATRPICLLVGGPGTGKTTTIAQIVQVLYDICDEPPHIGLAAPTGKAATRMQSSLADRLAVTAPATSSPMLIGLRARTVHGLLGMRPGRPPRFNAANPLPHDVVIVDETSMVSLTHLAAVLAATRPDARLILVGDPDQLASVDVGAVLADLVNRPVDPAHLAAARLPAVFASGGGDGTEPGDSVTGQFPDPADVARAVTRLRIGWRFTRPIAELAEAIRGADEDMVGRFLDRYRAGREPGSGPGTGSAVRWWPLAADQLGRLTEDDLPVLAGDVRGQHRRVLAAASCGDAREALRALQSHQILTAHRQGPFGAQRWAHLAGQWSGQPAAPGALQARLDVVGSSVLVTRNDPDTGLSNGDVGVVVAGSEAPVVAFEVAGELRLLRAAQLPEVLPLAAMTIHRAQGSQYQAVSIVLPGEESPLLTRELLYTAVTRAEQRVELIGTRHAVLAAVCSPAARASGLLSADAWRASTG